MVVTIVVTAYVLALLAPASIYSLGVWCFTGFSGLFPLVFASLYWRRVTTAGAIASILATLATWGYLFHESGWGANERQVPFLLGMLPAAPIVIASAATLVIVSFLTSPPPQEVVDRFFAKEEKEKAKSHCNNRLPRTNRTAPQGEIGVD